MLFTTYPYKFGFPSSLNKNGIIALLYFFIAGNWNRKYKTAINIGCWNSWKAHSIVFWVDSKDLLWEIISSFVVLFSKLNVTFDFNTRVVAN